MRKGRSVVHKTIEDNYTAVVVANHEALAQVLDQVNNYSDKLIVLPLPLTQKKYTNPYYRLSECAAPTNSCHTGCTPTPSQRH